jgi:hypothetical protein
MHTFFLRFTSTVVASVRLDDSDEQFDLKLFLEIFFENFDNLQGLRQRLEREDEFAQEIFWTPQTSNENSSESLLMGGSAVVTFFGLAISFVGFAAVCMWSKRRRQRCRMDEKQPDQLNQISYTHSYDTDDCIPPTGVGIFPLTKRVTVDSKSLEDREIPAFAIENHDDRHEGDESYVESDDESSNDDEEQPDITESLESRMVPPHLTYTPALMTTESNIEVPETPLTAFFGTPAGGGTKSVLSFGGTSNLETPKLPPRAKNATGPTSTSYDTKRKVKLPKLWKSTFRRDVHNDFDKEDSDCDDNGSDTVAFTPPPGRRSNNKRAHRYVPHPPFEIGGPETIPPLVPSNAAKDDSVGIVDEIAYLYSTTQTNNMDSASGTKSQIDS